MVSLNRPTPKFSIGPLRAAWVACVACLILASAFQVQAAPSGSVADTVLSGGLGLQKDLAGLAKLFPKGADLGDELAAAAGVPKPAALLPPPTFQSALLHLYRAAGLTPPLTMVPPEPAAARFAAPAIDAVADAGDSVRGAFASLSPTDQAFLWAQLGWGPAAPSLAPADRERTNQLMAHVDLTAIQEAAARLGKALGHLGVPPATQSTWVDPLNIVEIGSTANDAYAVDRVLIVDLGGDDTYTNNAAAFTPLSGLPLQVSAIVDVGGDDTYTRTSPSLGEFTWAQGVGIGGIGLLVDQWGNDVYTASITNASTGCVADATVSDVHRQMVYAQGVGEVGVGALLDLGGSDIYTASSVNTLSLPCHWGKAFVFAQGTGLHFGLGALIDNTGNDQYIAFTEEAGKDDNLAHTHAQAAAGHGIGLFVDKEGNDSYDANANAHGIALDPLFRYKGAFAYVFAQASVFGLPDSAYFLDPVREGCRPLGLLGPFACASTATPEATCSALEGLHTTVASKAGTVYLPCIAPGAALLLDVLGSNRFNAIPTASEPDGCYWISWAVSSSQGSAAWTGAAALVVPGDDNRNTFNNAPSALGIGCDVRAHAYGQGYAGHILYDMWDDPTALLPVAAKGATRIVALGVLANGAPVELRDCSTVNGPPLLPPTSVSVCPPPPLPFGLFNAPDFYSSTPTATNTGGGPADAQSWAQGVAGSASVTQFVVNPGPIVGGGGPVVVSVPDALSVGVHVDTNGNDAFSSQPSASSACGGCATALSVAQGASQDGLGLLANVGGNDRYTTHAWENGFDTGPNHAQAYADAQPDVGVLVDLFGTDTYVDIAQAGCETDGVTFGTFPALGILLGPGLWGTVFGNPCAPATPGTGQGTAVGLDWLSEYAV
jgi:hypothetical protein